MELKLDITSIDSLFYFSSNRTFMELKSSYTPRFHLSCMSSNRTFMELKYKTIAYFVLKIS